MRSSQKAIINFRCLGTCSAEVGNTPTNSWQLTKAVILFHYLLDRSGHVVDRATLTETFWSDHNASAPETSLKVAVHSLRRTLSDAFGQRPGLAIETHSSGYRLVAEDVWYDAEEFERVIAAAGRVEARGDTTAATAMYHQAVRLYRGDFLPGASGGWVLRRRHALTDQCLLAVTRLAEIELDAGEYPVCLAHCLKALDMDACRERTYQLLMLCHARLGQFGRVQAWYETCEQILRATLDVRPSADTEELLVRLLGSRSGGSPAHRPTAPAGSAKFGH